ncbi:MAG: DUF4185 domain-containing protein [Candidatus Omnitrophica bacterium]|nr:DUF4185 domain-containing protein [Candidatus Omnitrophota bacterium]
MRRLPVSLWILIFILGLPLRSFGADPAPVQIESATVDPLYDNLFLPQDRGWLGADGAVSIPLSPTRVLWIFGDTMVGTLSKQKGRQGMMPRNTIAIQDLSEGPPGEVEFFWDLSDNIIGDFFPPDPWDAGYWYWPGVGELIDGDLFLFMYKIVSGEGDNAFSFELDDLTLFRIPNPQDSPREWTWTTRNLGWVGPHQGFASAIQVEPPYVYLLGYDDNLAKERSMVLSRVRIEDLKSKEPEKGFEFWVKGNGGCEWSREPKDLEPLFQPGVTESSIHYNQKFNRYIAITHHAFDPWMLLTSAPKITGPWSEPVRVYQIPEMLEKKERHAYAMKAHPELATASDELVVTYVVNTSDFWSMFQDTEIYYPRFVRVKLK